LSQQDVVRLERGRQQSDIPAALLLSAGITYVVIAQQTKYSLASNQDDGNTFVQQIP
jgi:hypothetical protein